MIITKGLGSDLILTQGYGRVFRGYWNEIIKATLYITRTIKKIL
jgi:hypothetical protein